MTASAMNALRIARGGPRRRRAKPQLFEGQVPVGGQQPGQLGLERRLVEAGRRPPLGQAEHRLGKECGVFLPERQQQQQEQRLAQPGVHLTDHPEVEEVDRVVPPHQVAATSSPGYGRSRWPACGTPTVTTCSGCFCTRPRPGCSSCAGSSCARTAGCPKAETGSLAQLPVQFHCDTCGISYDGDFDQRVELRFSVHPAIRSASSQV